VDRSTPYSPDQKLFALPFSDIDDYQSLVGDFYRRQLTFEGDSLFAFAGITGALSHVFEGGFLCGLPELFFNNTFLWTWNGSPKRKIPPPGTLGLPSWSWAGWYDMRSSPECHSWDADRDYVKCSIKKRWTSLRYDEFPNYQTYPILQWYSSNTISPEGRRPVANRGYAYRDLARDLDQPLSSGWSRHEYIPENSEDKKEL
jgi:hypothetical protein